MGIPGLRGGDHIGITVPDMGQAHEFLVGVLGCEFVYALPEMRHDDDWMLEHLNVDPRRVVNEIRFYRCGFGVNFEVFEYQRHDGQRDVPRNSDLGGHHVAFYVDDMEAVRKEVGIDKIAMISAMNDVALPKNAEAAPHLLTIQPARVGPSKRDP